MKFIIKSNKLEIDGLSSMPHLTTNSTDRFVDFENAKINKDNKKYTIFYENKEKLVSVKSEIEYFDGLNVVREKETVSGNTTLSYLSTTISGIAKSDNFIKRLNDGSLLIYYCINLWQKEGQWRSNTPEELGLICATKHEWEKSSWRIDSLSSFSTGSYYPLIFIEDKLENKCYFFELEAGTSWFIEISLLGGLKANDLSISLGTIDSRQSFKKTLNGSMIESTYTLYGLVGGGIEEAVKELYKYRRVTRTVNPVKDLIFNDYMNCNWAIETTERLIPLIDKASKLNVKYFVIDDGWQKERGVWEADDSKFNGSFKKIIDYIKEKNMIPGVWFEFESITKGAIEYLKLNDSYLKRDGEIIDEERPLANMRSQALLDYFSECVDHLYTLGIRYIKNDHNNNELMGIKMYDDESYGVGLKENADAFIKFIDSLKEKYPDLIIENCGSGAMRSDNGTLKHFNIQSTSDQELYYYYPSILSGSLAFITPEKAGIWCYPYPLLFDDRTKNKRCENELQVFKNGEETAFNVINGFMGNLYLSGKINEMDDHNLNLLKEGLVLYEKYKPFIFNSFPIYPNGFTNLSNQSSYSFGLINDQKSGAIIAIWNLKEDKNSFEINLSKYGFNYCELIYPINLNDFKYEYKEGNIKCFFNTPKSARLFHLKTK